MSGGGVDGDSVDEGVFESNLICAGKEQSDSLFCCLTKRIEGEDPR